MAVMKVFVKEHGIDREAMEEAIGNIIRQYSQATFRYDIETYKALGVLQVIIEVKDQVIKPLLFGAPEQIDKIKKSLSVTMS